MRGREVAIALHPLVLKAIRESNLGHSVEEWEAWFEKYRWRGSTEEIEAIGRIILDALEQGERDEDEVPRRPNE